MRFILLLIISLFLDFSLKRILERFESIFPLDSRAHLIVTKRVFHLKRNERRLQRKSQKCQHFHFRNFSEDKGVKLLQPANRFFHSRRGKKLHETLKVLLFFVKIFREILALRCSFLFFKFHRSLLFSSHRKQLFSLFIIWLYIKGWNIPEQILIIHSLTSALLLI